MSECWNRQTARTEAPRGYFPVRVQVPPRSLEGAGSSTESAEGR